MSAGDNRPAEGVRITVRPLLGGPEVTVLSNWNGEFRVGGLHAGTYAVLVQDAGFEPVQETVQIMAGSGPSVTLYLRRENSAQATRGNYAVSVRELSMPPKARKAFEKGVERLKKRDPAGSLTHFQRAVVELPSYYEAYLQMGVALIRLGQMADAEKAIVKAIELSNDTYADADFVLGGLFCDRNLFLDAERLTRRGLLLAPSSWRGYFELGRALLGLDRVGEAEQTAEKARSLNPDFSMVYLLLANIHLRQQAYPALLQDLDDYLRLDPNGAMAAKARANRDTLQRALSQAASSALPPKP